MLHNNLECRVQLICIGARAVHFEISIELNNEVQPIKCTAVQLCNIIAKYIANYCKKKTTKKVNFHINQEYN